MNTTEVTVPMATICYLINGDAEGLTVNEISKIEVYLAGLRVIDVVRDEDGDFEGRFSGCADLYGSPYKGAEVVDVVAEVLPAH
jgi:hypothetical protein